MNGVLGWDIGGVNTKVARVADAQLLAARAAPYALQRDPAALAPLLAHLAHDLGAGPADAHAVTMTAELSQLFRTKREGVPLVEARLSGTPCELVSAAVTAGARVIVVLDLDRVGSGRGVDCELVQGLRRAHPHVDLLAGGGIGTGRELERLAAAGLDAALVATALHDGRIKRDDVAAVRRADHPSDSR